MSDSRPGAAIMSQQIALGFVAGFVDTVSFIALGGIFVSMITGNIVLTGASLLKSPGGRLIPNLVTVPTFVVAVATYAGLSKWTPLAHLDPAHRARSLLLVQAALLGVFSAVGSYLARGRLPLHGSASVSLVACIGVAAMAVQNAFTRLIQSKNPPTTIMTGNLVQVTMALVSLALNWSTRDRADRLGAIVSLQSMMPGLAGFVLGAALAAPLVSFLQFQAIWIACVVLLLLAIIPWFFDVE